MVWFIVIVMVGSIIGYAALFKGEPEAAPPSDPQIPSKATMVELTADDINGTVFQLLPSIHLIAKTNESDIMKLNQLLGGISGLYKIGSRYAQSTDPEFASSLLYVADISFDNSKLDPVQLAELIEEQGSGMMEVLSFRGTALVEIPKQISFENPGLGLSIDYDLTEGLVQTQVDIFTRKDDRIVMDIQASFIGNQLVGGSLLAFESLNLETEPKTLYFDKELEVASLGKRLRISAEAVFSYFVSFEDLGFELLSVGGIEEIEVTGTEPLAEMKITIQDTKIGPFKQDLNEFISLQPDVNEFNFSEEEAGLVIGLVLVKGFDSDEFISGLSELLSSFEVAVDSLKFEEPNGFYYIDLNSFEEDTTELAASIQEFLEEKSIDVSMLRQPGTVVVEFIADPDSTNVFVFEEADQEKEAWFKPGHNVGDKVLMELFAQTSRDLVLYFTAVEKEEIEAVE